MPYGDGIVLLLLSWSYLVVADFATFVRSYPNASIVPTLVTQGFLVEYFTKTPALHNVVDGVNCTDSSCPGLAAFEDKYINENLGSPKLRDWVRVTAAVVPSLEFTTQVPSPMSDPNPNDVVPEEWYGYYLPVKEGIYNTVQQEKQTWGMRITGQIRMFSTLSSRLRVHVVGWCFSFSLRVNNSNLMEYANFDKETRDHIREYNLDGTTDQNLEFEIQFRCPDRSVDSFNLRWVPERWKGPSRIYMYSDVIPGNAPLSTYDDACKASGSVPSSLGEWKALLWADLANKNSRFGSGLIFPLVHRSKQYFEVGSLDTRINSSDFYEPIWNDFYGNPQPREGVWVPDDSVNCMSGQEGYVSENGGGAEWLSGSLSSCTESHRFYCVEVFSNITSPPVCSPLCNPDVVPCPGVCKTDQPCRTDVDCETSNCFAGMCQGLNVFGYYCVSATTCNGPNQPCGPGRCTEFSGGSPPSLKCVLSGPVFDVTEGSSCGGGGGTYRKPGVPLVFHQFPFNEQSLNPCPARYQLALGNNSQCVFDGSAACCGPHLPCRLPCGINAGNPRFILRPGHFLAGPIDNISSTLPFSANFSDDCFNFCFGALAEGLGAFSRVPVNPSTFQCHCSRSRVLDYGGRANFTSWIVLPDGEHEFVPFTRIYARSMVPKHNISSDAVYFVSQFLAEVKQPGQAPFFIGPNITSMIFFCLVTGVQCVNAAGDTMIGYGETATHFNLLLPFWQLVSGGPNGDKVFRVYDRLVHLDLSFNPQLRVVVSPIGNQFPLSLKTVELSGTPTGNADGCSDWEGISILLPQRWSESDDGCLWQSRGHNFTNIQHLVVHKRSSIDRGPISLFSPSLISLVLLYGSFPGLPMPSSSPAVVDVALTAGLQTLISVGVEFLPHIILDQKDSLTRLELYQMSENATIPIFEEFNNLEQLNYLGVGSTKYERLALEFTKGILPMLTQLYLSDLKIPSLVLASGSLELLEVLTIENLESSSTTVPVFDINNILSDYRPALNNIVLSNANMFGVIPERALNFTSLAKLYLDQNLFYPDKPARSFPVTAENTQMMLDYLESWRMVPGWIDGRASTIDFKLAMNRLMSGYPPTCGLQCSLPDTAFCEDSPNGCTNFWMTDYWITSRDINADVPFVSTQINFPSGKFRVYTLLYGNASVYAVPQGGSNYSDPVPPNSVSMPRIFWNTDLKCALDVPNSNSQRPVAPLTMSATEIPNVNVGACDFDLGVSNPTDNVERLSLFGIYRADTFERLFNNPSIKSQLPDYTGSSAWPVRVVRSQCPPGTCQASPACVECRAGRYGTGSSCGEDNDCALCEPGLISVDYSEQCLTCKDGYSAQGAICQPCQPGKYGVDGNCLNCPEGQWSSGPGELICQNCTLGKSSSSDGASCVACSPGTIGIIGMIGCIPCLAGRYQEEPEQTVCKTCVRGTEAANEGATGCTDCDRGMYYDGTNTSAICVPCPVGKFQTAPGSSDCSDCFQGKYAEAIGAVECAECGLGRFSLGATATCELCSPGSHQNYTAQANCSSCPVGQFSYEGQALCTDCEVGKYSAVIGQAQCDSCDAGRFAATQGLSECSNCTIGKFASGGRQSACSDCTIGNYGAQAGLTICAACDVGKYQNITGQSSCITCEAGKEATDPGYTECTECVPGKAGVNCMPCQEGTYQDKEGQVTCVNCSLGTYSGPPMHGIGAVSCLKCPVGTYGALSPQGIGACAPCTNSSTSPLGTPSRDMCVCKSGSYGRAENGSDPICYACSGCAVCPGGEKPVAPAGCYLITPEALGKTPNPIYNSITCTPFEACLANSVCAPAYTGELCHSCASNHYRVDGKCMECPNLAGAFWVLMILLLFAITLMLLRFSRPNLSKINSIGIFLSGVQIISVFGYLPIEYPEATKQMFKALSAANFNLDLFSPECSTKMRFYGLWMFKLALPFFFAAALGLIYLALKLIPRFRVLFYKLMGDVDPKERGSRVRMSKSVQDETGAIMPDMPGEPPIWGPEMGISEDYVHSDSDRFIYCIVSFVTLLYTFLASTASQPFQCNKVGSTWVLYRDASELCYTDEWRSYATLGGFAMAAYTFGFPAMLLVLLVRGNRSNRVSEPDFLARYGTLVVAYRSQFYFWEVIDMLRKAGVVLCIAFLPTTTAGDKTLQINIIFLLTFAFLLAQVMTNPFEYNFCNRLYFVWLTTTLLTLVCALLFHSPGLVERDRIAYAVFLLIIVLFSTAVTIYVAIREIRRAFWRATMEKRTGVSTLNRRKFQRDLLGQIFEGFSHDVWRKMRIYNDEEGLKFFHYLARNVKPSIAPRESDVIPRKSMVNGVLVQRPKIIRAPSERNILSEADLQESDRVAHQGAIELARISPNVAAG